MNTPFTDEQIRAYATVFREGDAIWCDNKWWEIVVNGHYVKLSTKKECSKNHFIVKSDRKPEFEGVIKGFDTTSLLQDSCRVTTLEDYKLKGGEKIVWLGESRGFKTHGKAYTTTTSKVFKENDVVYIDDGGCEVKPVFDDWGIIPRYEQVTNDNPKEKENPSLQDLIQINADLIPDAEDLITGRNEVLSEVSSLLKQTKQSIELASQECKSTARVEFLTTVAKYKAKKIVEITEGILKNKGYTVVSTLTTELEEGYSSVEYISTIKLVINW